MSKTSRIDIDGVCHVREGNYEEFIDELEETFAKYADTRADGSGKYHFNFD